MERADWDINDVFNATVRHKILTGTVTWTRVDLAIDYYNTNLKVEPLANKVTRRSVVSAICNRRITVMTEHNAHGRKHKST